MKLDLQTVANVFANRLGSNNRRVMSAPSYSDSADFDLNGAILRVQLDQHLTTTFTITEEDDDNMSRAELAAKYGDPAVQTIKSQFEVDAKDYVVTSPLPARNASEAVAESNNVNVRVRGQMVGNDIQYTLDVLLGTFSL